MENPEKDKGLNLEGTEPALAPLSAEEAEAEDKKNEQNAAQADDRAQSRRSIVHLLAGAYLIYLGYNLCKNVIQGAEGASPVFLAAGVVFAIIGAVLCVMGGKNLLKADKEKKAAEQKNNARAPERTSAPEPEKKPMSIAERARLVSPPTEDDEEE